MCLKLDCSIFISYLKSIQDRNKSMGHHPTTSLHQKSEHDGCLVSRQAAKCLCQCKWPGGKAMPIAKFWRKNRAPEEYLLLHIGDNDVSSWFNDSKLSQQNASHLLFCITAKGLPWKICFTIKSTLSGRFNNQLHPSWPQKVGKCPVLRDQWDPPPTASTLTVARLASLRH